MNGTGARETAALKRELLPGSLDPRGKREDGRCWVGVESVCALTSVLEERFGVILVIEAGSQKLFPFLLETAIFGATQTV